MRIRGRRILIAGSANETCDPARLLYAHQLIDELVRLLASEGATFSVMISGEPRLTPEKGLYPMTFDWHILEVIHEMVLANILDISSPNKLITTVTTTKTEGQVPENRRILWDEITERELIGILPSDWVWASGAIRRSLLSSHADILITLGGGEGVEHYGSLFSSRSKPVIPLDLDIGSSSGDGSGGSLRIVQKIRSVPHVFFPHTAPDTVIAFLQSISTLQGRKDPKMIAGSIVNFLKKIEPPTAFYTRLLNPELPQFQAVEHFFRNVMDVFVKEMDYTPVEIGKTTATKPFLEVEIFARIFESTLVIVDITASRPNCLIELGYALALGRRIILTAMKGEEPPFDIESVDRFIWDPGARDEHNLKRLFEHWDKVRDRPSVVGSLMTA